MEAILTYFRFYTNYADIHISSEYFYLSLLLLLILNPSYSLPTINQTTTIVHVVFFSPVIHFRCIETLLITLYPNASEQF